MYIKGIVTIKLIDKKTNKIKYKTTHNNTMLKNGAYCLMYGLTGKSTTTPISRILVFDENKNYVKTINLFYCILTEEQNTLYCYLGGPDHSEDEYTYKYITLDREYSETPIKIYDSVGHSLTYNILPISIVETPLTISDNVSHSLTTTEIQISITEDTISTTEDPYINIHPLITLAHTIDSVTGITDDVSVSLS